MNIDTKLIEGYAEMSAEEKVAALEKFEYNDHSEENAKLKNSVSKANAEAAEWKKKHNALLDDDERKQQETAEKYAEMEKKLAALEKEKTISTYKASYLSMGYSDELALDIANATANGDMDKVFECQKKFLEAHDKEVTKGALKNTPRPGAGGAGSVAEEYAKKAEEALKNGSAGEAAYYTRLAQSSTQPN